MFYNIFIHLKPFSDSSGPVDGNRPEETTPIRTEIFIIKVISQKAFM